MDNLFYCFGFIYVMHSFYKLYDWSYGQKIIITVDNKTTFSDIQEMAQELNNNPKNILYYLKKVIDYLCFSWVLFGVFSNFPEWRLFFINILVVFFLLRIYGFYWFHNWLSINS